MSTHSPPPRIPASLRGHKIRRRPLRAPWAWRLLRQGNRCTSHRAEQDTHLILQSRNIPYFTVRNARGVCFYVPPLYENIANTELTEFAAEKPSRVLWQPIVHPHSTWAVVLFVALVLWHGLRVGWWPAMAQSLAPQEWWNALLPLGQIHSLHIKSHGQWCRAVTALTLHADILHLLGNVAFGCIFVPLFCRRVGVGVGCMLVLVAGALANIGNVFMRDGLHISIGFSTSLFAAVGGMAGAYAAQALRPKKSSLLGALGAALAILAMLGTGDQKTDYGAHIWGLALGMLLGGSWQYTVGEHLHRMRNAAIQWLAALAGASLLLAGWYAALHSAP